MKKPWTVGLLSLVPGLGLMMLGEIWKGVAALISVPLLFIGSYLTAEAGDVSVYLFVAGLIVWGVQMQYAFMYAKRRQGIETGEVPAGRQVDIGSLPVDASAVDKSVHHMRQVVTGLLGPGENLKAVLQATTQSPSLLPALLAVLLGGTAPGTVEWVYLGLTDKELIIVEMDALNKPSRLRRIPLEQVKLEKNSEGAITDELVLDMGSEGKFRGKIGRPLREETRKVVDAISRSSPGKFPAVSSPMPPDPILAAADPGQGSTTMALPVPAPHPVLSSALVGALGGIAGSLASGVIAIVAGVALSGTIAPSTDFAEGMGYVAGFYCVIMFPIGGAILGAIPGAAAGMLRISRDEPISPLPIGLAGFLTVLVLSLGAFAALLLAV